jgi:uncharacterized phage protein (TIGR02216 family)
MTEARFTNAAARLAGLAGALLGWRPDEFWRATPAELGAVLAVLAGPREAGVTRGELAGLMARFPDQAFEGFHHGRRD